MESVHGACVYTSEAAIWDLASWTGWLVDVFHFVFLPHAYVTTLPNHCVMIFTFFQATSAVLHAADTLSGLLTVDLWFGQLTRARFPRQFAFFVAKEF